MPSENQNRSSDPTDPRPALVRSDLGIEVAGSRCGRCGHPTTQAPPLCPSCGGRAMEPAAFGPFGRVFSSTVLRVPVAGRTPPLTFAYVDLDDGPRILAHVAGGNPPAPDKRVRLVGWTQQGDPLVTEEPE